MCQIYVLATNELYNKVKKCITHYMMDKKLFLGDTQKVSR
jgi:hypothetical protein